MTRIERATSRSQSARSTTELHPDDQRILPKIHQIYTSREPAIMLAMQAAVRLLRTYTIPQSWLNFTKLSIALLVSYSAFGVVFAGLAEPYLNGLNTLQHFLINYSVGVLVGFLIAVTYYLIKRKEPNLPLLLTLAVFWSHVPDILFIFYQSQHPFWMNIFFLHPILDNSFNNFYFLSSGAILLITFYKRFLTNG